MELVLSGIIVLLLLYIISQERRHQAERRDLYNRIMAKDYEEYKEPVAEGKQYKNAIRRRMEEMQKQRG